jgi:hypothetical protein
MTCGLHRPCASSPWRRAVCFSVQLGNRCLHHTLAIDPEVAQNRERGATLQMLTPLFRAGHVHRFAFDFDAHPATPDHGTTLALLQAVGEVHGFLERERFSAAQNFGTGEVFEKWRLKILEREGFSKNPLFSFVFLAPNCRFTFSDSTSCPKISDLGGLFVNLATNPSSKPQARSPKLEAPSPKLEAPSSKRQARSPKLEARSSKLEARSPKLEAPSPKPQARSSKLEARSSKPQARSPKPQARSAKLEAPSSKLEARSPKLEAPSSKRQARSAKLEAPSSKPQARSPKLEAPSSKPQAPSPKPQKQKPAGKTPGGLRLQAICCRNCKRYKLFILFCLQAFKQKSLQAKPPGGFACRLYAAGTVLDCRGLF